MKHPLFLGLVAVSSLLVAQSVQAVTIVASDDNYVLNSSSNSVQDSSGSLVVKRASNNIRKSWLKFDLTGQNVDFTQPGTVTLTLAGNSSDSANFRIALYALDYTGATAPTWTEDSITWNNAPGNDTGGSGVNDLESGETTLLSETGTIAASTPAGTQYQFVISDLSEFLQSDNTITTIVISSSQSNAGPSLALASSENATEAWRPTLTFSQIPEPSAAMLIGLTGFIGVSLRLRRRR